MYSEAAGIGRIIPSAVAAPTTADDVGTLVQWSAAAGMPITPRGSGSSMAGGAIGPGLIIDLSLLKLLHLDAVSRRIWCGPGALRGDIERAAHSAGLRFPVDPSSGEFCTIGGMVATNAAGAHTLKHGSTRRWITALDCIFADGSRAIVRRGDRSYHSESGAPPLDRLEHNVRARLTEEGAAVHHVGVRKESSGYGLHDFARTGDVIDLIVGSEGTLALVVGVELELAPAARATSSLRATFADLDQVSSAASMVRRLGASVCELLDSSFLRIAESGGALPRFMRGAAAVLLVEVEADAEPGAARMMKGVKAALTECGALSVEQASAVDEERELWDLRYAASPILARDPVLKSVQVIEDAAVPPEQMAAYVRGVRAALARQRLDGVIFGHAGDGHVHVNPLVDVRDPDWRARLGGLLNEVTNLVATLGGTLSGEHGDGRLRAPLLPRAWRQNGALDLFRAVKETFDPSNILNPGVKLALTGQQPFEMVKYDPAIEPLPVPAAAALETVARYKAYATHRLALLQ
ncbi:MAG: FAD-binding oxidoreductase [Gemmatimonadaceae bacterium]|nr:FAD-binding oxidoreductase [Gemmatimonadaceae bacterium]